MQQLRIGLAQHGEQNATTEIRQRPIDIKQEGPARALAEDQHIAQVRVVRTHRQVVRHHVLHPAHTLVAYCLQQLHQFIKRAEFAVHLAWIANVVAMLAARIRLSDRRGVDVADTQVAQVRQQRPGLAETKRGR